MNLGNLEDILIPLAFFALAVIIVVVAINAQFKRRELEHKERMLALEKGLPVPSSLVTEEPKQRNPYRAPLVWIAIGVGMLVFALVKSKASIAGLSAIPLCIGIALLIANVVYLKRQSKGTIGTGGTELRV